MKWLSCDSSFEILVQVGPAQSMRTEVSCLALHFGTEIVLFIVWDILFKKQKHSSIVWGFQLSRERALKTDGDFSFDLKKGKKLGVKKEFITLAKER